MLTFRAAILSITQLVAFRRQFSTVQSPEVPPRFSSVTPFSFVKKNTDAISVVVTVVVAIFSSNAYINSSNMATLKVQGEANKKLLEKSMEISNKANEKLLEKSIESSASSIKESIEANAKLLDRTLLSIEKARRWFP